LKRTIQDARAGGIALRVSVLIRSAWRHFTVSFMRRQHVAILHLSFVYLTPS
jgi:hypothetical protein